MGVAFLPLWKRVGRRRKSLHQAFYLSLYRWLYNMDELKRLSEEHLSIKISIFPGLLLWNEYYTMLSAFSVRKIRYMENS